MHLIWPGTASVTCRAAVPRFLLSRSSVYSTCAESAASTQLASAWGTCWSMLHARAENLSSLHLSSLFDLRVLAGMQVRFPWLPSFSHYFVGSLQADLQPAPQRLETNWPYRAAWNAQVFELGSWFLAFRRNLSLCLGTKARKTSLSWLADVDSAPW